MQKIPTISLGDFNTEDRDVKNPIRDILLSNNSKLPFLDLESVYFSEYVMPLRGAHINQKYGYGTFLMNLELRLPLLVYYFPAIKYLGQISAVLFSDFGFTWNDVLPKWEKEYWKETNPEGFIWTYGIGPRFIFFGLPWQLDYAWKMNPFSSASSNRSWFLTIGVDF